MERVVSVLRSNESGTFILHPMGTFRRYGGYVGINPYRELPGDCSLEILGQLAVDLLTQSGPTGYAIGDIARYREATADEESRRIRNDYFSGTQSPTSRARRFLHLEVSISSKQRSWHVVKFKYDAEQSSFVPDIENRVKCTGGPSALGLALSNLLS